MVLVEATRNQVNQYGGYTGMRPDDFRRPQVEALARTHGGPPPTTGWCSAGTTWARARGERLPAQPALTKADALVGGVRRGRVHQDPPGRVHAAAATTRLARSPPPVAAQRTARLAAVAERAAADAGVEAYRCPVYVIGTEVPVPGGQADGHEGPVPTRVEDAERGLDLTRAAFARRGLVRAWERVLAQVVQPGVEFGDDVVFPYRREAAAGLRSWSERQERLVFEAHSTDYQCETALRALVEDHFAILKVGPELTFTCRTESGRWRPAHGRDRRPASHASGSGEFSPAIPGRARPNAPEWQRARGCLYDARHA